MVVVLGGLKAIDKADKKGLGASSSCVVLGWLKAVDKVAQKGDWGLLARVLFWVS